MPEIEDGTGSGNRAKIDVNKKLHTLATTADISVIEALKGNAYNMNTGTISLTTTASENGLLYAKNTGENEIIITGFFYLLGNQASSGNTLVRIYRNPTTGTLISGGSAQAPVNRDHSSSKTATGTFLKGADASTVTNGTVAIESLFSGTGRQAVSIGAVVLGRGDTIAVTVKPPSAMDVQIAMAFYEKTEDAK